MPFRRFIIFCLALFTILFSWNLLCTWKKAQLEKKASDLLTAQGDSVDYQKIENYLHDRYGFAENPIWKIPIWGPVTYPTLKKCAVSKGSDMRGGRITMVRVDEKALLKAICQEGKQFRRIFDAAKKDWKQDPTKPFLECFIDNMGNVDYRNLFKERSGFKVITSKETLRKKFKKLCKDCLKDSISIMYTRLDEQGTKNYDIVLGGPSKECIMVSSPEASPDAKLNNLVKEPGELRFYIVYGFEKTKQHMEQLQEAFSKNSEGEPRVELVLNSPRCLCKRIDRSKIREKAESLGYKVFFSSVGEMDDEVLFVETNYAVSKDCYRVKKAEIGSAKNMGSKSSLNVTLDEESEKAFGQITGDVAAGKGGLGNRLVIALDDTVVSCADVKCKLTGAFCIEGAFTSKALQVMKTQLLSGYLPAKLEIADTNMIGPSLGEKAQKEGFQAIWIALVLILLFMIFYYAIGGLIANVALLFNILFILGGLAQFGSSLTLPGIAGVILTIGMAIDANVLIFARILEELEEGVPMKQAIKNGYKKAYRSIIDSNATTLITGLILFSLGTGLIKGFATTLVIGIISSFVTAVILSQIVLDGVIYLIGPDKISFSFPFTKRLFSNMRFDFLGKRKWTYSFSILFILSGLFLTYRQGLDWGIEFTGGKNYTLRFGSKIEADKIKEAISKEFQEIIKTNSNIAYPSIVVRKIGSGHSFKITTNFAMGHSDINVEELVTKSVGQETERTFLSSIDENTTILQATEFTLDSSGEIGASMAGSVKQSAILAVLFALLCMLLYIFVSFRNISLAIGALIALVHDTVALFACLAFAKFFGIVYEIDQIFISTILTVIGYSINDTVVIFDRIREKMKIFGTNVISVVANDAVNTTLSRTIITSFTTLLPVATLYIMGGIALEGLAFFLLFGIMIGTYSSIFIATPIANDVSNTIDYIRKQLKKKEKRQ